MAPATTVDAAEIARFSALADAWWDETGAFAALHRINPVRLAFLREHMIARFGEGGAVASFSPFAGRSVLDIGCGGGILCEPMRRLGATVTGIDPSCEAIAAAGHHAGLMGLEIDYRAMTAEALAETGATFDVVLAMEVVEHVTDVPAFVGTVGQLVRPDGLAFLATINRTLKAFALAIVGAEYVLGWVPRGTHQWDRFVTPDELESALGAAGLAATARAGVIFDPLAGAWRRGRDMDVNYMLAAARPGAAGGLTAA